MGIEKDQPYGQGILDVMRPFVDNLIAKGLSKKTIRRHMNNLWLLGGEIIRDVSTYNQYHIPPGQTLRDSVYSEGGPYCQHLDSESDQRSFDSTCRKLYKFLEINA